VVRKISAAFIALYIGALGVGLGAHILNAGTVSHPIMYYLVWDMFCGWSAYDTRMHVIAEGESQNYYRLTPAPWGEFHPYGMIGREHYDTFNNFSAHIGLNVLKHTTHEPITRIFVVEECWAKKFNLPMAVWNSRYDEPKDKLCYYHVRSVTLPDHTVVEKNDAWIARQGARMFADNPRLQAEARTGSPVIVTPGMSSSHRPELGRSPSASALGQMLAPSAN
jgi:hypothetical protein